MGPDGLIKRTNTLTTDLNFTVDDSMDFTDIDMKNMASSTPITTTPSFDDDISGLADTKYLSIEIPASTNI